VSSAKIKPGEALQSDARGTRCRRRAAPLDAPCRCAGTDAGGPAGREARDAGMVASGAASSPASPARRSTASHSMPPTCDASAADADLSAATSRADAARLAVAELDKQIEAKGLGLARLKGRQPSFVQAAMLEYVEAEYGNRYRDTVENLRALARASWGARAAVGLGPTKDFEVPSFGLVDKPGIYPDRDACRRFDEMIKDWTK
jgi:hypothetical protein